MQYIIISIILSSESSSITFISPYAEELSRLRMEKLRIEEEQYLELKRQAELERIRGPKPKWLVFLCKDP